MLGQDRVTAHSAHQLLPVLAERECLERMFHSCCNNWCALWLVQNLLKLLNIADLQPPNWILRKKSTLYECHLGLGCEFPKCLKFEYYFSLSKTELSSSLCVSTSDVLRTLATTMSCVGCRRSVETLYTTLTNQVLDIRPAASFTPPGSSPC